MATSYANSTYSINHSASNCASSVSYCASSVSSSFSGTQAWVKPRDEMTKKERADDMIQQAGREYKTKKYQGEFGGD